MMVESDEETEELIYNHFSFFVDGYKYMPLYKAEVWDGQVHLYNINTKRLYFGLYNELIQWSRDKSIEIVIIELERIAKEPPTDNYSLDYIQTWVDSQVITSGDDVIELRDYQEAAIIECLLNDRKVIKSPTSSGKTLIMYLISKFYFEHGKRILILTDSTNLVSQTYTDWIDYSQENKFDVIGNVQQIHAKFDSTIKYPIAISTWQSQHSKKKKEDFSYFNELFDAILIDECFPGDVEILTNKGFVRFDNLTEDLLCAQYSEGRISFVTPIRYIKNEYSGELITLKSDKRIDISMTPNHELLIKTKLITKKIPIKEAKFSNRNNMIVAGELDDRNLELTPFERLMIAYQADGSLHYKLKSNNTNTITFSFSKQRKIDRFLSIIKLTGLKYSEVKGYNKKRRFMVYGVVSCSKLISDIIDINTLDLSKAKDIIKEMIEWDGHKHSENNWYYSSTIKSNVDFYQCVALLCGYKTNSTIQVDDRSSTFNNIYRLYIQLDTMEIGTQKLIPVHSHYTGMVYCVQVPSGNIVVRRNGKPLVVGNCHKADTKSITGILENCTKVKYRFGFSGSVKKSKVSQLQLIGLIGNIYQATTTRELIDRGEVADIKINMLIVKYPKLVHKALKDKKYPDQINWITNLQERNKFIVNLAADRSGNSLILFNFEEHGKYLFELTKELYPDIPVFFINGNTDVAERESIRAIIETLDKSITIGSFGTIATGWSVKRLHNLIFAHPYKSPIKIIQSIGRVLRLGKNKFKFVMSQLLLVVVII